MVGVSSMVGVSDLCTNSVSRENSKRNYALGGIAGNVRATKGVAFTCVAKSVSLNTTMPKPVPKLVNVEVARVLKNPAEELLEQWAKQPAASSGGRSSETEAVRRLFMWDALPKKGLHCSLERISPLISPLIS